MLFVSFELNEVFDTGSSAVGNIANGWAVCGGKHNVNAKGGGER